MPIYTYKAKNLKGEELKGSYDASTMESLEAMLNEKGYFLVEATKAAEKFSLSGLFDRINMKDLAVFCRQFAVIINAGITVVEAISILTDQMEKKKFRAVLAGVHEELQKGKILSSALALYPDIFPEFLISMVRIGEASGSLELVMNRLADYYEKENRIKRKIRVATTYPTILGILTVGVVILLMVKVLPMFAGILESMGGEMPFITRMLMGISKFMVNNLIALLLLIILIISALSYYFKTEVGKFSFDGLKLRMPVVKNTSLKVITSRFARSMGILLKSGIPIINAIDTMSYLIGNRVVEEKFKICREEVKEGKSIASSLKKVGVFPPLLLHMVSVGENTGELDEMLTRTAGFFDEEVEESVEKLTAMIEPLMIVIMAAIVGTILISIMLPMISIMGTIN